MGDSKVDLGGGGSRLNRDGYQDKTVFVNTDEPFYGPPAEGAVPFSRRTSSSFGKKEAGKLSFGIGDFEATPRVFFKGSQTGRTPTVSLPEGDVLYDQQNFNVSGKLGADVRTPGGDTLGASAAGYAYRGGIEFPDAMKKYGAENVTYNSRGVELSELGAYYQMEGGPRFEASSRPTADPTADPEHSARVSYTRRFEDGGEIGYYPEGPPMGGYAYGGEVSKEPSAISSVNAGLGDMEPILSAARGAMQRREAKPAESLFGGGVRSLPTSAAPIPDRASSDRDPRSEANASLMLKKAGLSAPKNFADFINGTNPDVLAQFDRLMGRGRSPRRSGSMGIGSLPNQKSPAGVS